MCSLLALLALPLLLLSCAAAYKRTLGRRKGAVAFFHPYCNAGGGGEFVLWNAIVALQERYPKLQYVVYTGDTESGADILRKVRSDFGIEFGKTCPPPEFVRLRTRWLAGFPWPVFTLLLQSLGSMLLGFEAFLRFNPDIFIDTTGFAFTFPVFRFLGGCKVGCYVHYPTISTDMLSAVASRNPAFNNRISIARSRLLTCAKLTYYRLFSALYGAVGRCAHCVMVNGSWCESHIRALWGCDAVIVFPPCRFDGNDDTTAAVKEPLVVSIGQFRPEKNHMLQVEAFALALTQHAELHGRARLVIVGSARGDADIARKRAVRERCAHDPLLAAHVDVPDSVDCAQKTALLSRACAGLHTMRDEHFGICVVEYMAAGAVPVAHRSAGPLRDIVVPHHPQPDSCGYLAETAQEYADSLWAVLACYCGAGDVAPVNAMAARAMVRARMFAPDHFKDAFVRCVAPMLGGH
eukprot:TRINITY_DN5211_c0_g1_i1.p1 TRINITY_DN5211_c0_g1~~TRINITY_DN5211_c0_g1_i1.p1  ORF type:complete len:464 (-),score=128.01 TRINITY_DN5211_c0_g1_i1:1188-2579(-)